MEDLWTSYDSEYEEKIRIAYSTSKDIFIKLFHWLDRDTDDFITQQDLLFGLSRIMLKDANIEEIRNVFRIYDPKKTGKLNLNQFLLAVMNGYLKKTLTDPVVKDNYLHN